MKKLANYTSKRNGCPKITRMEPKSSLRTIGIEVLDYSSS
jgi:hypothetical protein